MKIRFTILMLSIVIGLLFALMGLGHRGISFLPSLIIMAGFVAGVGFLLVWVLESIGIKFQYPTKKDFDRFREEEKK